MERLIRVLPVHPAVLRSVATPLLSGFSVED